MIVFPPVKINLGLYITNKRNDGFHDLETVFYEIPLCDILEIHEKKNSRFISTGLNIPETNAENNLCVKAANLFYEKYNISEIEQAAIHLHKIIPMGAGLGGGSSDAVYTLKSLYAYYDIDFNKKDMFEMSTKLGSDCAFFIDGGAAFASGRGEVLNKIELDLSGYYIVIIKPNVHVSTAQAFANISPKNPPKNWKDELLNTPLDNWKTFLKNDFEESIFPLFPEIKKVKEKLYDKGALFAIMSGSGASVFGVFKSVIDLSNTFPKEYFVWQKQL